MNTLQGKKTYICVIAAVLYLVGVFAGLWSFDEKVLGVFGFASLAALRSAFAGAVGASQEPDQKGQLLSSQPTPTRSDAGPMGGIVGLLAAVAVLCCAFGCASFQKTVVTTDPTTGASVTNQVFDVTRIAPAVKTAAYEGTAISVQEHPEWRDGFNKALTELKFLEKAEHIDFPTIMAIVQRLPVKELKSTEARLAITGGTMLLSEYGGSITALNQLDDLKPIVTALRAGVELGLE